MEKVLLDMGLENYEVRDTVKSMSGPGTSMETRHGGMCYERGGGDGRDSRGRMGVGAGNARQRSLDLVLSAQGATVRFSTTE